MSQLLGIKFNDYGQIYYFSSGPFVVEKGQSVLVKTEQGMGLGTVASVNIGEEGEEIESGHETIYRLANDKDFESKAENDSLAREAHSFCRKCIETHGLEMKLVDVEVFFDRSKMIFYFTAPGRIDFRELIKDLVKEYRTRIELRQIGVRHETQMLGAIGNCGQLCCCRRFLRKFVPVTIKMAKEQNLFLNPTKISGICGRLLCCLSYEQQGYEEFNRKAPKVGKRFSTSLGSVKVIRTNFFRKTLTFIPENGPEQEVDLDQWQELRQAPDNRREDRPSRSLSKEAPRTEEPAAESAPEPLSEPEAESPAEPEAQSAPESEGQAADAKPSKPPSGQRTAKSGKGPGRRSRRGRKRSRPAKNSGS